MEIYVFNKDLDTIGLIDNYQSVIWTTRFFDTGDFELYLPVSMDLIELLKEDNYLCRSSDITVSGNDTIYKNVMIIENITIKTDVENGNYLTVSGRSLKNILSRRIIWQQTNLTGHVELCIRRMVEENAVTPIIAERKIKNLEMGGLLGLEDTIDMQVTGDNLCEVIAEMCKQYGIGFDIYIINKNFRFELYVGENRSYNQEKNPYVVFSSDYENLLNTEYKFLKQDFKNVALVAGEGEGLERKTTVVGTATGLDRYEKFVDARDVSSNNGEYTEEEYIKMLEDRGHKSLEESKAVQSFDGSTETRISYELNKDYFLGDIVQVINEYGIEASPRILEIIESEDENGRSIIPTFSTLEVG